MSAVDTGECLSEDEVLEMRESMTRAEIVEFITDTRFYCEEYDIEEGREPGRHFPSDAYDIEDLLDMWEHCDCPLHANPEYPYAPCGVWGRDVNLAGEALDRLTEKHTGRDCSVRHYDFHATAAELREVWEEFPHARWWYDKHAAEGTVTITVVDDE